MVQTGDMVYIGRFHGKGGPAHAVEGAQDHGPTGTVCTRLVEWRVDEDGIMCGVWDQPADGGEHLGGA